MTNAVIAVEIATKTASTEANCNSLIANNYTNLMKLTKALRMMKVLKFTKAKFS